MKKFNDALIFLTSLASMCIFVKDFNNGAYDRLLGSISIIFVLFIPRIVRKLFKVRFNDAMELVYIIFIILAQFIGSVLNLYNTTWWYDVFAHFLSGILTTILALVVLDWFKMYKSNNKSFNILFMIMFTLMVASIWEFLEFGADTFLHMNVQHSLDTGVRDTMEDMLCAFTGSIIVSFIYLVEDKLFKKGLVKKVVSLN